VEISAPGGQTIEPGKTGRIAVKMSTRSYTNELVKEIRVETNDPERNMITFTMKALVVEALKVTPRLVNFGKMLQGETSTRSITLENRGKEPVRVTSVKAVPPSLLSLGQTDPFILNPGQKRTLDLTVSSGSSEGFVSGYVNLETDLDYLPKKTVRIRAEVKKRQNP
jgi:hypothetical protein